MSDSYPYEEPEDVEFLLDVENVVGVDVDPDGTVVALVTEKIPEAELSDGAVVSNLVDQPTDVRVIGEPRLEIATPRDQAEKTDPKIHKGKHRPAVGGVSEGRGGSRSAGTAGPFAAVVVEVKPGIWRKGVKVGDFVRVSNNHVYAGTRREPGHYGGTITQPAGLDGGGGGDVVGHVCGYVPLVDRVTVDVAARTADRSVDAPEYLGIENAGHEIRRSGFGDLVTNKESLQKTGRTTGVRSAEVIASSATVRVKMSDNWTNTFTDQLVTGDMSRPGDSGSAVFDMAAALTGVLYAGSDTSTIVNKITNVERELGIQFLPKPMKPDKPGKPDRPGKPDKPGQGQGPPPGKGKGGGKGNGGGGDGDDEPDDPKPPVIPPANSHVITVARPKGRGSNESPRSFAFSMDFVGDLQTSGRSSTITNGRVNSWVVGWTKVYFLAGHIETASIPDYAVVTLNGHEIEPSQLPDLSRETPPTVPPADPDPGPDPDPDPDPPDENDDPEEPEP